ncbi:putative uncharacterized protein (plasmid) [Aliivibrio wodanis]|uniref:Uncharacterized protein n=1 Tax=Aliivibrio wodanis TaxID=80852 RepID=A0A090IBW1_9GAMM|nr:putative uncharacterized protein [Aliivibrio wodanis]
MTKPSYVDFEEFFNEFSLLKHKNRDPFTYFSIAKYEDDKGVFFLPSLERYDESEVIVTGNKNGYLSREKAICIMGKCLDRFADED